MLPLAKDTFRPLTKKYRILDALPGAIGDAHAAAARDHSSPAEGWAPSASAAQVTNSYFPFLYSSEAAASTAKNTSFPIDLFD